MKFAEKNETLYFIITGDIIYTWNGVEVLPFSDELRNIKEFSIADSYLYVLHKDSSISVWHTAKKKNYLNYFFLTTIPGS